MTEYFFQTLVPTEDPYIMLFILFTFLVSGIIKGFLGIGLPAAAMALLTLVMNPKIAISLLTLPIIFTNVLQFAKANDRLKIVKEYKYFSFLLMLTIFLTSIFIASYSNEFLTIAIGVSMVIFSLNQLLGFKIKINSNKIWQILFGIISGVLGGLSSIWSPPVAMYLMARQITKEKFIASSGFLLLSGCFPLAAGLIIAEVFTLETAIKSLIGLIFVLIGFRVGEILRKKISQNIFITFVLIAFLIMGVRLIIIGIL